MIYIEANSGAVKRVGRSDAHATEFDLEAEEYVPLPKVCKHCNRSHICCFVLLCKHEISQGPAALRNLHICHPVIWHPRSMIIYVHQASKSLQLLA